MPEPQSDDKALTQFRQQVCALLEKQADVLFALTDAVLQTPHPSSFTALALAPAVTRGWSSLSEALSTGRLDAAALRQLCLTHLPVGRTRYHFALDVMSVRRLDSPTLHCHGAQREVGGTGVIIPPGASAVALTQTRWLAEHLPPEFTAETALDGGYGNVPFFLGVQGQRLFATARLRNDHVFYQIPSPPPLPPHGQKPRGQRRKYGAVFKCSDATTWPPPDETLELTDASYGRVRLQL